ncbi:T3SS effector HopA1 family protein [Nocardiopsis changdeensis]|uniref:Uncharacterized protein n=1 Tax=Nocardiopsis changdeensis TaxID=2831969 RepID=A0ABX8BLQ8_9ACTN|nr:MULTISPECIES: T3SS effector HopA1 family protein [Nocardiopsis]QUX23179.1 hypothetical protein KGD84_01890 [Nocardiopsis changdeensis]QYX39122.1 hypothetical protein K1J57_11340 [Nocardiopsis sp. MT53]
MSATTTAPPLAEPLRRALDEIDFAPDGKEGEVRGHRFEGTDAKHLTASLANALYLALHTGRPPRAAKRNPAVSDPRMVEALRERVPHDTSVMEVPGAAADGGAQDEVVVRLGGVRVRVPRAGVEEAPGGSRIRIPSVLPRRSPGFLMVHGSRGHSLDGGDILRLYLSVPDHLGAPGVWGRALTLLEEAGVRYQAKALSTRSSYPRNDAIVVYLGSSSWPAVPALVEGLRGTEGLGTGASLYTAPLAPGVAWAWEPDDEQLRDRTLSFGQHRSRLIAEGLVRAVREGTDRAAEAARSLEEGGVPAGALHRGHGSPDIGL